MARYNLLSALCGAAQLRFAADSALAFARPAQLKPDTLAELRNVETTHPWSALRRPVGCSGVAILVTAILFLVWTVLTPGPAAALPNPVPPLATASLAAAIPTAIVFSVASAWHLWRANRRLACLLSVAVLPFATVGVPVVARSAGLLPGAIYYAAPAGLGLSAIICIALIVGTPPRAADTGKPNAV